MLRFKYIVFRNSKGRYPYRHLDHTESDPYENPEVRYWDQMLHRALNAIFRRLSSGQIKRLLRAPSASKKLTDEDSIFDLILQQQPALGKLRLKRSKLPLLWIAVLSCYQDSAELLVSSGADVQHELYASNSSPRLYKKSTLLHALPQMYPSSWNERFCALLMDRGVDFKTPADSDNFTPLHWAVRMRRVRLAEMFLERGADANAAGYEGLTPLLEAAESAKVEELLPLLMRHGADLATRDEFGSNVLRYLTAAPDGEHVELARVLIEKGVSPREMVDSNQHQPIHLAVFKGKDQLVNLFLDHGADVNARGHNGECPLYVVAWRCENPAVLLTLLKRGANVDLKTNDGLTVLHGFGFYQDFGRSSEVTVKLMKLLLALDVDMFVKADNDGPTAFELIHSNKYAKHPIIVWLMLRTLALRKARPMQPSVEPMGEGIVEKYPELWTRYQDCVEELDRIRSTKFVKSGAIFELLTKCQCQVVELMRYREFRCELWTYLRAFPAYAEDIVEAYERAERYYDAVVEQEKLINEAAYHALPHVVARKVAGYAVNCEVCEMKRIVEESRKK